MPVQQVVLQPGQSATVRRVEDVVDPTPTPPPSSALVFELHNSTTGAFIRNIDDNATIEKPFSIEVEPGGGVESVQLFTDGTLVDTQNNPPYLYTASITTPYDLTVGAHRLRAVAWTGNSATGSIVSEQEIDVTVTAAGTTPPPPTPTGLPSSVTDWLTPAAESFLTLPAGWDVTGQDLFDTVIAQGNWGKPGSSTEFPAMTDGDFRWRPTKPGFVDSSKRGEYSGQWTTWTELVAGGGGGGVMKEYLRSGVKGVVPFVHNPNGQRLVSRPLLIAPGHALSYDDVTRFFAVRIDLLAKFPGSEANGYKVAYLFWGHARVGEPGYSEDDYPEFQFGDGLRGNVFYHHESRTSKETKQLNTDTRQPHLYTTELWAKGYKGHATGYRKFYLDGQLMLSSTNFVTTRDVYYAKQAETLLAGSSLPTPNAAGPDGTIETRLFRISEPE